MRGLKRPGTRLSPLALIIASLLLLSYAAPGLAARGRLLGVYGGLALYEASSPPDTSMVLRLNGGSRAALWATMPSPRVQEILSNITVHVARVKIVYPVSTPWGVLYWAKPPRIRVDSLEATGAAGGVGGEKPLMLVVIPNSSFEWFGEEVKRLHNNLRVVVLTWNDVMRECGKPAPPPPGAVKPGELKRACGVSYNLTKALCLISLERRLLGEGLRYLLIVGDARVSPPIYYRSPLLSTLGMHCGEYVPSDYWFADPNYDWKPEVAVGRLPFTDRDSLETYLKAARAWLSWSGRGSGFYAGGAPFQTTLMLGELGVMEASQTATMLKHVAIETLSLGNYKPLSVQSSVGDYGLYYIASHGVGDVLLDVFPRGLWGAKVDVVLAPKLLGKRLGFHPGVYVTPACLSAYWDTDLVEPPFNPPSVGVALLEKGYAVDYFGSTRVAIAAVIKVSGEASGVLDVKTIGAIKLTSLAASLLTESRTVGEAIVKALAAYSSLARGIGIAYTAAGSEDIAVLTMLEFTLLGDPALPAPASNSKPLLAPAPSIEYNATVPVQLVMLPLSSIVEGNLPLVMGAKQLVFRIPGDCPIEARLVAVRRYYGYYLAELIQEPVRMVEQRGSCIIRGVVVAGPSLHYLILHYRAGIARFVVLTAGVAARTGLGRLSISAYGLDLLRVTEDEPIGVYVDGRLVAWIPGGVDKADVTIPARGNITVALRPWRMYVPIVAGSEAFDEYRRILNMFTLHATIPALSYRVTGNGIMVEAVGGSLVIRGASRVERVAPNEYLVIPSRGSRSVTATLVVGKRSYSITIPVPSLQPTTTPMMKPNTTAARPPTGTTCTIAAETVTETKTVTSTKTVTRTYGGLSAPSIAAVLLVAGIVGFAVAYAGARGR